ncbi:MAG: helix-turn-helix domain-containing protein [Planctomycetota bacterium]|nr:helix-turn-helix domain-containing protein [Planctomycetota bacterium]
MPFPHKYITLTPEERKKIEQEIKRLTLLLQWKKQRPLKALLFSDQKMTFKNIAETLRVSYTTVRRWVYAYRKHGLNAFIRNK